MPNVHIPPRANVGVAKTLGETIPMNRTTPTLLACLVLTTLPAAAAGFPLGPGAPPDLAAAAGPGAGTVTLAWGPAESLTGVTSYHVYRVAEDGARTLVGSTDGQTLGFAETGLPNGATVTYVVTAVDALGEGPASQPATATTFTTPSEPQGVAAAPGPVGTVGEVVVSWAAPATDGGLPVAAFLVYRDGALVATLPADATAWTDGGRDLGAEHVYAVSAMNAAGEGALSASACSMASPWGLAPGAPSCMGLA